MDNHKATRVKSEVNMNHDHAKRMFKYVQVSMGYQS